MDHDVGHVGVAETEMNRQHVLGVQARAAAEQTDQDGENGQAPSNSAGSAEVLTGEVIGDPAREEITLPIQEQLIVELYSR